MYSGQAGRPVCALAGCFGILTAYPGEYLLSRHLVLAATVASVRANVGLYPSDEVVLIVAGERLAAVSTGQAEDHRRLHGGVQAGWPGWVIGAAAVRAGASPLRVSMVDQRESAHEGEDRIEGEHTEPGPSAEAARVVVGGNEDLAASLQRNIRSDGGLP